MGITRIEKRGVLPLFKCARWRENKLKKGEAFGPIAQRGE
jgi:hypothetical protein